jgi:hypothetical protein
MTFFDSIRKVIGTRCLQIGRLEIRIRPKGRMIKNCWIQGNIGLPVIRLPEEGNEYAIIENVRCGGIAIGNIGLGAEPLR